MGSYEPTEAYLRGQNQTGHPRCATPGGLLCCNASVVGQWSYGDLATRHLGLTRRYAESMARTRVTWHTAPYPYVPGSRARVLREAEPTGWCADISNLSLCDGEQQLF